MVPVEQFLVLKIGSHRRSTAVCIDGQAYAVTDAAALAQQEQHCCSISSSSNSSEQQQQQVQQGWQRGDGRRFGPARVDVDRNHGQRASGFEGASSSQEKDA